MWVREERLTWCWRLETKTMVTIWPDDVLSHFQFISCPYCVLWALSFSLWSCSTSFFIFPFFLFFSFFISLFFHLAFFSSIFHLLLRLCISFAGEVNSVSWTRHALLFTWTVKSLSTTESSIVQLSVILCFQCRIWCGPCTINWVFNRYQTFVFCSWLQTHKQPQKQTISICLNNMKKLYCLAKVERFYLFCQIYLTLKNK